jgi:hypothetical protein
VHEVRQIVAKPNPLTLDGEGLIVELPASGANLLDPGQHEDQEARVALCPATSTSAMTRLVRWIRAIR